MQKRTSTGAISSPTAAAGYGANIGAHELAAWAERAAPQGVQGLGNPASSASPTPPIGQPFAQGAAPPVPPSGRAEARGRIHEAIAMQRAYEDDNGTPTDRATFNLQRRQARQADHTSAPAMSPRENAAFKQANQHFEQSHLQSHSDAQPQQPGVASGKPRGFQIHKVQAAAQAAKGNQYTGPDDDGSD